MDSKRTLKRACLGSSIVVAAIACALVAGTGSASNVAAALPSTDHGHAMEISTAGATVEFTMSTDAIAEGIAHTGQYELPHLTPPVFLTLEEFEIFLPGERNVVELDADGSVARETPYVGRLFRGHAGEGGSAFLLVAPEGLYGVVETPSAQYSLQPVSTGLEPEGTVLQQISIAARDPAAWRLPERPASAGGDPGADVTYDLHIKAWADYAYKNYASDYANRITSAYGYVAGMWESETNIYLGLYAITSLGFNFAYANTCAGVSDTGRNSFNDNFLSGTAKDLDPGAGVIYANSYALFSASQSSGPGVGGCGDRFLSRNAVGGYAEDSNHAIQGKDWHATCVWFGYPSGCDSYDPDSTAHLGLAAGHELTHNANAGLNHPNDSSAPCYYNIMANGQPFQCKWPWRTAGTIAEVNSYAPSRLS